MIKRIFSVFESIFVSIGRLISNRSPTGAIALILVFSFPGVIFFGGSLALIDAVPFSGVNPYSDSDGNSLVAFSYPEFANAYWKGWYDGGGTLWQSEPFHPYMNYLITQFESVYWNPFLQSGIHGVEGLINLALSPLTIVSGLLGGNSTSITFVILSSLFVAGFSIHQICTRFLGLDRTSGVAAAVFFMLNGYMVSSLGHNFTQPILLAPAVIFIVMGAVTKTRLPQIALSALVTSALLLCSFMPTLALVCISIAFFLVGHLMDNWCKHPKGHYTLVSVGILAACLTAFFYLPLVISLANTSDLELLNYGIREFFPLTFNASISLITPKFLWQSYNLTPNEILAEPFHSGFLGNNSVFHFGLAASFCIFNSFRLVLLKSYFFQACFLLFSLGLLRIFSVPSAYDIYKFSSDIIFTLPFFTLLVFCIIQIVRSDNYWIAKLLATSVIILWLLRLAGYDIFTMLIDRVPFIGSLANQYVWSTVILSGTFLVAYGINNINFKKLSYLDSKFTFLFSTVVVFTITKNFSTVFSKTSLFYVPFFLLLCVVFFIVGSRILLNREKTKIFSYFLIGFIFFELNFYQNHSRPVRGEFYSETPDFVSFLKNNSEKYERVVNIGSVGLAGNASTAFQIFDVSGMLLNNFGSYQSLYLNHMTTKDHRFFTHLTLQNAKNKSPDINHNLLDILGVKHVVVGKYLSVWVDMFSTDPNYSLVFENNQLAIFENKDQFPRAFRFLMAKDSGSEVISAIKEAEVIEVPILDYSNTRVVLDTSEVPVGSRVVLTDNWSPFWVVDQNSDSEQIDVWFNSFRSFLANGSGSATFRYYNRFAKYGLMLSLVCLIFCFILGCRGLGFQRFKEVLWKKKSSR